MSTTTSTVAYPWHVYRGLHSRLVDYLIGTTDEMREAVVTHVLDGQWSFAFVLLAILDRRIQVTTELSEDGTEAWIGLRIVSTDDVAIQLVRADVKHLGIDARHVVLANRLNVEEQVDALLLRS